MLGLVGKHGHLEGLQGGLGYLGVGQEGGGAQEPRQGEL